MSIRRALEALPGCHGLGGIRLLPDPGPGPGPDVALAAMAAG
ncbi:hypothetical protein [Kitasatospora sp. NPDC005856]